MNVKIPWTKIWLLLVSGAFWFVEPAAPRVELIMLYSVIVLSAYVVGRADGWNARGRH